MGLTVADVILRNLFTIVVPGGMEMTGLLMTLVALSTLAIVEIARSHIQVDLVLQWLPESIRIPTIAGGLQITCAMMIIATVQITKELPATLLLRPLNVETLATHLYGEAARGTYEEASVSALAIVVIAMLPVVFLSRVGSERNLRQKDILPSQALSSVQ